jgi:hypothetical protein
MNKNARSGRVGFCRTLRGQAFRFAWLQVFSAPKQSPRPRHCPLVESVGRPNLQRIAKLLIIHLMIPAIPNLAVFLKNEYPLWQRNV